MAPRPQPSRFRPWEEMLGLDLLERARGIVSFRAAVLAGMGKFFLSRPEAKMDGIARGGLPAGSTTRNEMGRREQARAPQKVRGNLAWGAA